MAKDRWYEDGICFTCTQCGKCCTGFEGFVWVDEPQMQAIADHLGVDLATFTERYVRRVGRRLSLIEKPNMDCIFWEAGRGCTVYPVRPRQCRTFPFWPELLQSRAAWEETEKGCPGAGQGRHYTADEIGQIAAGEAETGAPPGPRPRRSQKGVES